MPKADSPRARGIALYRAGRFSAALAEFERGLALAPDDADLLRLAGACLLERLRRDGDVTEGAVKETLARRCAEFFRRYAEVCPPDRRSHFGLGLALFLDAQYEDAARQYALCIECDPRFAPARYALGSARFHQGRYQEAVTHYRLAARLAPGDASARHALGCALLQTGDRGAARDAFEDAVRLSPDDPKYARSFADARFGPNRTGGEA